MQPGNIICMISKGSRDTAFEYKDVILGLPLFDLECFCFHLERWKEYQMELAKD